MPHDSQRLTEIQTMVAPQSDQFLLSCVCVHVRQRLQVIFMFGEIDCREGLTMAVDKLKYETVDAAMEVLLTIYKGAPSTKFSPCFDCTALTQWPPPHMKDICMVGATAALRGSW